MKNIDANPMDDARKAEGERLDAIVATLRKEWDSVQIFVSRETTPEDVSVGRNFDNTIGCERGSGNYCTRVGQATLWLERVREAERMEVRGRFEGQ